MYCSCSCSCQVQHWGVPRRLWLLAGTKFYRTTMTFFLTKSELTQQKEIEMVLFRAITVLSYNRKGRWRNCGSPSL